MIIFVESHFFIFVYR